MHLPVDQIARDWVLYVLQMNWLLSGIELACWAQHQSKSESDRCSSLLQDHPGHRSILAEQLLQYTRQLELRILQLEEERNGGGSTSRLMQHSQTMRNASSSATSAASTGTAERPRPPHPPPYNAAHNQRAVELGIRSDEAGVGSGSNQQLDQDEDHLLHSRPEAVTRALRVLQVRNLETIDRGMGIEHYFELRFCCVRSANFWNPPVWG